MIITDVHHTATCIAWNNYYSPGRPPPNQQTHQRILKGETSDYIFTGMDRSDSRREVNKVGYYMVLLYCGTSYQRMFHYLEHN